MVSIYDKLSVERKQLQRDGQIPDWFITVGWQLFKDRYLHDAIGIKDQQQRIAKTLAKHTNNTAEWGAKFFDIMWKGWLAPSTPVYGNTGTNKGLPVSCSGGYIDDSINGFYSSYHETAMLTKNGFGTSGYLGDIRPRGSVISSGGRASGLLPIVKHFVQDMRDVAQGTSRRGAWAGYVPAEHGDFFELANYIEHNPDDLNIGWNISDAFLEKLNQGDADAVSRWKRMMKLKCVTGKGYFFKVDEVNRKSPEAYKKFGLKVKASNLCTEITLYSDKDHTFTCVLSSLNLAKYDEWKNTDAVFVATVFLDCVVSEFLELAKSIPGMERAINFTVKSRALGLGALGFHTYLQQRMVPLDSFEAHMLNIEIFQHIKEEALNASAYLARTYGEPEWCEGTGLRNTHLLAVAPNTSSSILCGGVSQGIEPLISNLYTQSISAGEVQRINPTLLQLAKERGKWDSSLMARLVGSDGSVQEEGWLSSEEKQVFKTAFEYDQSALIRLAAARQPYICQAQSLNLFFDANEKEEVISAKHKEALLNPNILSLYYLRTLAGVKASTGECVACEG